MTGFVLKIIAVITMIFDHIRYAVPLTDCFITKYGGRLSFPIFAFLITEGLIHTKSRKKYFMRMFIFACISQIPFMLFRTLILDKFMLNIMFTFLFAMVGITILEIFQDREELSSIYKFIISVVTLITILLVGNKIPVDYSWFGILTVWIFYFLRDKKVLRTVSYIILVVLYYISRYIPNIELINMWTVFFTALSGIIILFYNGKEGKKLKYFFYLFYPIHMLILYGLYFIFK